MSRTSNDVDAILTDAAAHAERLVARGIPREAADRLAIEHALTIIDGRPDLTAAVCDRYLRLSALAAA